MKKEQLHISSLIFGSLLGLAIAFSQFLTPLVPESDGKAKTEQTKNEGDKETDAYISLPSFSLPAPVHVESNLNPYCLFEIFMQESVDEDQEEENLLLPDRLFVTLFRVIISPNAP